MSQERSGEASYPTCEHTHPHLSSPAIDDPAVRCQQYCRAEVLVRVPPVRWAAGGAAGAEDALIQPVELVAALLALVVFRAPGK